MQKSYYFAYGANLCLEGMKWRCPAAEPISGFELEGWRLVFRGVADIEPSEGSKVSGALWRVTPQCIRALDRFEGYPDLYGKGKAKLFANGKKRPVFWYSMGLAESKYAYKLGQDFPCWSYLTTMIEGRESFGVPQADLVSALNNCRPPLRTKYNGLTAEVVTSGSSLDWSASPPPEQSWYYDDAPLGVPDCSSPASHEASGYWFEMNGVDYCSMCDEIVDLEESENEHVL